MDIPGPGYLSGEQKDTFLEQYVHFLDDDLNTVGAIGLIFEKVKEMNRILDLHGDRLDDVSLNQLKNDRHNLFIATRVLGLLEENPEEFFRKLSKSSEGIDAGEVESMIQERSKARAEKDWAQADALRDRLQEMGIVLEDGAQGTTWRFDV
jgi:cysteinyl-tRNA synthetase